MADPLDEFMSSMNTMTSNESFKRLKAEERVLLTEVSPPIFH